MDLENIAVEQREQFMAWYQQIKQKEKDEHIRKTREGLRRAGAKPGRRPLGDELLNEIWSMKEKGYRNLDISKELKERGKYLSTKTIGKYVRIMKESKGEIKNENNT